MYIPSLHQFILAINLSFLIPSFTRLSTVVTPHQSGQGDCTMASSATARKLIAALSLLTAAPAVSFVSSTRAIRSFSSRSGSGGTFRSSTVRASPGMLLDGLLGGRKYDPPCVMGEEEIMSPKEHGTSKGAYRGFLGVVSVTGCCGGLGYVC